MNTSLDPTWLVACTLASYYITYVVVFSDIFRPVRNLLSRVSLLMALLSCPHCFSMWAAAGVLAAYWFAGEITSIAWVLVAIAVAGGTSVLFALKE